ncbi:hypothetical protein ACT3R7_14325 [Halomonas sp. AOP43-A1-21]|uniref:hypothetical protein n=1 Tax=Halomonas TaxID=2745 RepID=UPI001866FC29|nr:hypothetical protein [Halomonas colorata]
MQQDLRVISRTSFFTRRVFPIIWLSIVALGCVLSLLTAETFSPFLLIPPLMIFFGVFIFKMMLGGLADRVYDNGDSLIFVYGKNREQVYLKDVANVNYQSMRSPDRVTLTVRSPRDQGSSNQEFSFLPARSMLGLSEISFKRFRIENQVVDELIERVDTARRQAKNPG